MSVSHVSFKVKQLHDAFTALGSPDPKGDEPDALTALRNTIKSIDITQGGVSVAVHPNVAALVKDTLKGKTEAPAVAEAAQAVEPVAAPDPGTKRPK